MNKKYLVSLLMVTILSLNTGVIFSGEQKTQSRSENTAILTIDTKNNEYTIEKDGEVNKGYVNYSANIDTDNFYNICKSKCTIIFLFSNLRTS